MAAIKNEATKALDLLESYYVRLDPVQDQPLREAIERLIGVFRSRLFSALVDIHDFYSYVLTDEQKTRDNKIKETNRLAEQLTKTIRFSSEQLNDREHDHDHIYSTVDHIATNNPLRPEHPESSERIRPDKNSTQPKISKDERKTNTERFRPSSNEVKVHHRYDNHWKIMDIHMKRESGTGWGFSVGGGTDMPYFGKSTAIVISKLTPNGLAARQGRLKVNDIIISANGHDFRSIIHKEVVTLLRTAGNELHLTIRRLEPSSLEQIEIIREPESNLGFSIAGGLTHEHVENDFGIFVTTIVPGGLTSVDGRLQVGDRLMSIQSEENTFDLEFISHSDAVKCIHQACKDSSKITLTVAHSTCYVDETSDKDDSTSSGRPIERKDGTESQHGIVPGQRTIQLNRGESGFGFSFIVFQDRTFVSQISQTGPARASGQLFVGDEILSINGTNISGLSRENVAALIHECRTGAEFIVISNADDFQQIMTLLDKQPVLLGENQSRSSSTDSIVSRRRFYVRAKVDYDPVKDTGRSGAQGLAFRVGDILLVLNAADDNYWQAELVTEGRNGSNQIGIIPSQKRLEKKERVRRKRVNFDMHKNNQPNQSSKSNTKEKDSTATADSRVKKNDGLTEASETDDDTLDPVVVYETLFNYTQRRMKPIIIVGCFREKIYELLFQRYPHRFARVVPYTSRPKKDNEIDGVHYHFIPTREQMQREVDDELFVEVGLYKLQLYGTKFETIEEIAKQSKHALLEIRSSTVPRLIQRNLRPIVILVKPSSIEWIVDNMVPEPTKEDARAILDNFNQIEKEWQPYTTVTLVTKDEEGMNTVIQNILEMIDVNEGLLNVDESSTHH